MKSDLSIDEKAALSRVLGHLENGSPVAPDLPSVPLAATSGRRWSASVVAAGAFLLAVVLVTPAAWLLRGPTVTGSPSEAPITTVLQEVVPPATADPSVTSAAPTTTFAPAVPAEVLIEAVSVPISGVESFDLAANEFGLFAAASVPNPDIWDERVWRSSDDGASWQEVLTVAGEGIVTDMAAAGGEIDLLISGHVVAGPSFVYRSVDGGDTWMRLEVPRPDGAIGDSVGLVAIGDSTVVTGRSWEGVREESFEDGAVLISTQIGVRSLAWKLDGDLLGAPVDIAPEGAVLDLAWTGEEFVAVGLAEIDSDRPAIWTSIDGVEWLASQIPDVPAGVGTDGFESVVVSGNGAVVALADVIGDNKNTVVYVMSAIGDWSVVQPGGYGFVEAVGTEWGFVTTGLVRGNSDEFVLVLSVDGTEWVTLAESDVYLADGVSTPEGAFAIGYALDGTDVGIWRVTAP